MTSRKQKTLEINPKSPLIEGLLRRVDSLPRDSDEHDVDAENELKEVASILIDGALVRSGFEVPDSHEFFARVDRVLRRYLLGVSETAQADATVKPAPPIDPELPKDEEDSFASPLFDDLDGDSLGNSQIVMEDVLKDHIQVETDELPEDEPLAVHDEL